MLQYFIQIIAFQLLFLLGYDLFLKRETFFNWNRAYLLSTSVLSFILPLIKIKQFKNVIPQEYVITLPEVIIGQPITEANNTIVLDTIILSTSTYNLGLVIFIIGALLMFSLFLLKLLDLLSVLRSSEKLKTNNTTIVILKNSNQAFSFFNYVFVGNDLEEKEKQTILDHESIHVRQKHTLDLLYFEILKIIFWFNPLLYIYQKRITTLHEYIVDASAIKYKEKADYYQSLLSQVFETNNLSFINTFFKQSLIKKRIVMLTKSRSKQINLIKYALLIPSVFAMLIYSSCSQRTDAQELTSQNKELTILENIAALKESIAAKGEMTKEEEIALKELIVLTSPEGVNHHYFNDVKDKIEIPFGVIENVPLHPNCDENISNEERKKCMAQNVAKHVINEFNTKLANENNISGKQRIVVNFKINNKGKVVSANAKADHQVLEQEAIRVINMLPNFKPGTHEGKAVTVPYALPIVFQINE